MGGHLLRLETEFGLGVSLVCLLSCFLLNRPAWTAASLHNIRTGNDRTKFHFRFHA
jgi:hypothetical protein